MNSFMGEETKLNCFNSINGTHGHLAMDTACLALHNIDKVNAIDIFVQSSECYKCKFWHLATIAPLTNISLAVNTTYTTLFSTQLRQHNLYGFNYRFAQNGGYKLSFNASHFDIDVTHPPVNIYLPILYAFFFYMMLAFMWFCVGFLQRRMSNSDSAENTPILNSGAASSYGGVDNAAETPATPPPPAARKRLRSLDAFRGLAIAVMIFVNYGGGRYYFFMHTPWNGLTVADLVFPWFMWIMGTAMVFSIKSRLSKGISRPELVLVTLRRSIILFALGILVNGISNNNVNYLRIPGVLQRFAICYLLTGTMEVLLFETGEGRDPAVWGLWWTVRDVVLSWLQWAIAIGLASIHTVITFAMEAPGCPRGYIGPGGLHDYENHPNCTGGIAGYIDRLIIGPQHIYQGGTSRNIYQNTIAYDPEGILGTMTSMLMVQFGVAAGRILLMHEDHKQRVARFMVWAFLCGLFAGVLCDFTKEDGAVPVNKNLWSLTYVLTTACFAFVLFAFIYILVDWREAWSGNPFRFAGLNSILLYVGHELTTGVFPFHWTPTSNHSEYLVMNLWGTSLWLIIAWLCHLKEIYISV